MTGNPIAVKGGFADPMDSIQVGSTLPPRSSPDSICKWCGYELDNQKQGHILFKMTIENDEMPKSLVKEKL